MRTFVSGREGQFTYFDHQLGSPDWTGKRVLDFGGNAGNFLQDPNCQVEPADYWCIDVSREAIAEGRRRHPEAHFVFYNNYNFDYNPTGTAGLPIPDPGIRFDFIVAFSVVTHLNRVEALRVIDQLMALLTEDGKLAFTFYDPLWTPPPGSIRESDMPGRPNLVGMIEKLHIAKPNMDVAGLRARAENASAMTWATLLVGEELIFDSPEPDDVLSEDKRLWGVHFCTQEHMRELFPDVRIGPPLPPERQHCAILDARKERSQR